MYVYMHMYRHSSQALTPVWRTYLYMCVDMHIYRHSSEALTLVWRSQLYMYVDMHMYRHSSPFRLLKGPDMHRHFA